MEADPETLARRALRFGKAHGDEVEVDEEGRLAELVQLRAVERKEAEKEGVLSSGKTRLDEAKDLVGICPGMISEYQYYWRKLRYNNIHALEKDENGVPRWYLTIKDYARSAAGNEQELPSDVRPPEVLLRTTDYILIHILNTHPFNAVNQAFIRDRARAIVKDFTMQHVRNAPAIDAHERIVRMAALSMHIFRDQRQPDGPFDHDGERKQFVNALSSLTQFYADARTPSLPKTYISQTHISPHEPEFTAYWHLFSLRRPPALPEPIESAPDEYPQALLGHPLFRLARTFVTLYAQSMQLVTAAENLLVSPAERAAKEAREAARGVHRFKRPPTPEVAPQVEGEEDWKPQRFEYPPGFNFPALGLLQRLADPGVPWVLAAVLEASALDDVRARAVWEIWQMRNGGDILVSELVELLGCDEAEDVRVLMDAIIEASGRCVRKLRPKGSDEVRAYRLVGSMKFPSHYPHVRRNVALIDSKRPDIQLSDIVNQPWDQTTNDYDLYIEDVPDLELPETVDVQEEVKLTRPALQGLESSRAVTPAVPGGVFAGFGAVEKKNPFGAGSGAGPGSSTLGGAGAGIFGGTSGSGGFGGTASANPFGGAAKSNPFGAKPNPFGTTTSTTNGASSSGSNGTPAPTNPFGASASTSPAPTNPFGGASTSTPSTGFGAPPAPTNPFGNKPTTSGFGVGATAFGAGASGFGTGSNAFGGATNGFGAGATAFGSSKPTPSSPPKLSSQPKLPMSPPKLPASPPKPTLSPPKSSGSKLSPFAASFVPKFGLAPPPVPAPAPAPAPEPPAPAAPSEDNAAAEAAKAAREAKLRERLEAAKKEEARARAQEERKKAEEMRRRQEAEEAARREEEARRRREEETLRQMEEAERRQAQAERHQAQARERLHSTTAQVLLGDILEILVVPEVQYAIQWEKRNRWLVSKSFAWWKARAAKRVKRRRVLENMGLGRVGVAGAAEEVGELFDEEDEEANGVVVRERTRTTSFRETRSDAELAAAMAKAAAERERLWAPGIFLDIVKNAVADTAQENDKPLEDIPGWDVWLCTSGVNQSSAEWLRKKFNARPTQLVDGTVSVASVTPKGTKKDSAPGLVVFECSPYLGAAMTEQEWSDAWSNEANRIARLFSAMSNRASYTPSLLFVVWSTDHVAQHSEAIVRKIKKSASHLADVSIHGEPSVAVLVDETVEEVFQEALSSLELDIEGRPVVELSSVTDSLSRQIASWHRTLSDVLRKIPSFDDEENAAHIAHVINLFFKAFNVMTAGITQLVAPQLENTIRLPDFSFNDVHDNKTLYNLADAYTASLSFPEPVDLNVLRAALRQTRHSSRPFPARFFCERITQLVDVTLTPSISGNRPRSSVSAAELAFETALSEAVSALDARTRKRVQETSPVRDSKKARISTRSIPSEDYDHPAPDSSTETSGAAKLRALLAKTRNRWAESDGNDS